MAYSALLIASYVYAAANPRVVRCPDAQDTHGGGGGKRRFCQSFDWAVAASSSRRTLMTPEQAAAETGDGTASAMLEIGRVNLQFAAARCGMVPFGAILASFLSQRLRQLTLWRAVSLLLCRCRRLLERFGRLRSCRHRWLRRERRAVRACLRCLR